jgi:glucose dehydrogenase
MTGACVAAISVVIAVSAQDAPRKPSTVQHALLPHVNAATSTNWSENNGDAANSRYSPLDQINTSNVGTLEL